MISHRRSSISESIWSTGNPPQPYAAGRQIARTRHSPCSRFFFCPGQKKEKSCSRKFSAAALDLPPCGVWLCGLSAGSPWGHAFSGTRSRSSWGAFFYYAPNAFWFWETLKCRCVTDPDRRTIPMMALPVPDIILVFRVAPDQTVIVKIQRVLIEIRKTIDHDLAGQTDHRCPCLPA